MNNYVPEFEFWSKAITWTYIISKGSIYQFMIMILYVDDMPFSLELVWFNPLDGFRYEYELTSVRMYEELCAAQLLRHDVNYIHWSIDHIPTTYLQHIITPYETQHISYPSVVIKEIEYLH